jgi:hypothetical protein
MEIFRTIIQGLTSDVSGRSLGPQTDAYPRTTRRIDQCRLRTDLGFLVTAPTDACFTLSPERQDSSLLNNRGHCGQRTTQELLEENGRVRGR